MTHRLARRAALRLSLAALAGLAAWPGLAQAADAAVLAPIRALNEALAAVIKSGKATPFPERFATLSPVVQQSFDLPTILRLVVGTRFAGFPPELQMALLEEFHRFTVASYVANFDGSSSEKLELLPETRPVGADQVVRTRIIFSKDDPVRVDYVMHNEGGTWRAVDVLLDGSISRVAVQRSDFRRLLETGGAPALIVSLRKKVADLSGGTMQ